MDNVRPAQFVVSFDANDRSVTISCANGLNDRAMREMGRLQWFAINHGWNYSPRNDNGMFTSATAIFMPEEFVAVRRYFDFVNQGISIIQQ